MKISVRQRAVEILCQISTDNCFAGELIDEFLDNNALSGTADGRLLTHLVYGVLRFRGHLDWILSKLFRGQYRKLDDPIKNVLRLGLYQLKFSDRLPDYAVVNEAVKIAKRLQPAQAGMINAVLRNYLRQTDSVVFPPLDKNPAQFLATYHSHPLWLVKKWIETLGMDETALLCMANNELPPLTLRTNTLKVTRHELQKKLREAGFEAEETRYSPDGIILKSSPSPIHKNRFFEEGLFRIQDEGTQLLAYLIKKDPIESILDACSGTGGKATHMAAIFQNKGKIVAMDKNAEKLFTLQKEAIRLGIHIIETRVEDLSVSLSDSFREKFDSVLVDAPCSGTGTLRRNPEIKWRLTERDLQNFANIQKNILQNTAAAVKKGGRLIYCTCSLLAEENEMIVEEFLKKNPNFSKDIPTGTVNNAFFDKNGFFYSYPHRHSMDGFFAAILNRQ